MARGEMVKGIIITREQVKEFEEAGFTRPEMRDLNRQVINIRRSALRRERKLFDGRASHLRFVAEQSIALIVHNAFFQKNIQEAHFLRTAIKMGEIISQIRGRIYLEIGN